MARKPDIYQASARVQVDLEKQRSVVGQNAVLSWLANDPVYFNTQLQILSSPRCSDVW